MSSPIVNVTIQGAALAALSNFLAQIVDSYQKNKQFTLQWKPISQFIAFALLSTPVNYLWQIWLERKFPNPPHKQTDVKGEEEGQGYKDKVTESQPNMVLNIVIKLAIDQTIGALFNAFLFIVGMGALKGRNGGQILAALQRDTVPLLKAGARIWPAVSALNFSVVPAEKRVIIAGMVGVLWGIYLSLLSA